MVLLQSEIRLAIITAYTPAELEFPRLKPQDELLPTFGTGSGSSGRCRATRSWDVAVPRVDPSIGATTGTHHQPFPAL